MALTTNLISYYKLDNNANDAHGSNNGTVNGATYTASGKINGAYDFDGVNDFISLPNNFNFGTSGLTISAWIKTTEATNNGEILFIQDDYNSHNPLIEFTIKSNGTVIVRVRGQTNTANFFSETSTTTVNDGNWHHLVLVFDDANDTGYLYIDGSEELSATGRTTTNINFGAGFPTIGKVLQNWVSSSVYYFDGIIDEFAIWNRPLSSTEVGELYNSGAGLTYPFTKGSSNFFQLF